MTDRFKTCAAALVVAFVTGCASAPSQVRVDQAEGGLPNCQTFAWHAGSGDAASLTDQRVRSAVLAALAAKGYVESTDKPDCRIAYSLSSHEMAKRKPALGVGVGGGSGGIGGGIGVSLPIGGKKGYDGTFTLDVIDSAKNAQVWSGAIDAELASAEISDAEAQALANEVLAAYPDRQK